MIRFSKREDYAVILINKLAKNYNVKLTPLSEISKEYNISVLFLRNLALELREAGLIKAVEGKSGGYYLLKNPKTLLVGDILKIFSKDPVLPCCDGLGTEKIKTRCPKVSFCQPGYIWRKLNKEFLDKIYNLTLIEFMQYAETH